MKKLKGILCRDKIPAALLAVLILIGLGYTSISYAKSEAVKERFRNCLWYYSITYDSDASKTTVGGGRTVFCDGSSGGYGTTSQYSTTRKCECIVA